LLDDDDGGMNFNAPLLSFATRKAKLDGKCSNNVIQMAVIRMTTASPSIITEL
jgi:hypothetical protein